MSERISRRMEIADRLLLQQADQAIGKDVTRALVELITNPNDRYWIMERHGVEPNGVIIVEIQRRHKNSVLRIRDYSTGMNSDDMDLKVGRYAEATSGFMDGERVRGLWGRGLKDAIYGLGHGKIVSISEGIFNCCALLIRDGVPMYERETTRIATKAIREQLTIPSENGTVVEITISRDDVRTPLFDSLRRSLEHHFEIRSILGNSNRTVILRELDTKGKIKQDIQLSYKRPVGDLILEESFEIPGFDKNASIELFRSVEPLSTPAEGREYADGGLLVTSGDVVLDLTLLKYEGNEYATRLYGTLYCDHFTELLKIEEPVLTATRDGINWKYPFAKALKDKVEELLEPFVESERRNSLAERRTSSNQKLKQKLNSAVLELNTIASLELGEGGTGDGKDDGNGKKIPIIPAAGFGFVPEFAYVQTGKLAGLTLRARIPDAVQSGVLVKIESDSPEVKVLTPQVVIEGREDFPDVGQARVEIEGRQVGAEAVLVASVEGHESELRAEAMVRVISVKSPKERADNKPKGGLFNEVEFDPAAEPRQRVRFDRSNSNIVIATKAPSVMVYLGEDGQGIDSPQAQVLLAELITEALCRELARQGVEKGKYLAPLGGESDAIQRKYLELQNQYAHRVHDCVVDSTFRRSEEGKRRKGRPSRDELLESAVTAAG